MPWVCRASSISSVDGTSGFERGPVLFNRTMRHTAVQVKGSTLFVYYSSAGDCPERILCSTVDLRPDSRQWQASSPVEVLAPELAYEGADLALAALSADGRLNGCASCATRLFTKRLAALSCSIRLPAKPGSARLRSWNDF